MKLIDFSVNKASLPKNIVQLIKVFSLPTKERGFHKLAPFDLKMLKAYIGK